MNLTIEQIIQDLEALRDDTICDASNDNEEIIRETIHNINVGQHQEVSESLCIGAEVLRMDASAINQAVSILKNLSTINNNIKRNNT